jgi:hypothetical protein
MRVNRGFEDTSLPLKKLLELTSSIDFSLEALQPDTRVKSSRAATTASAEVPGCLSFVKKKGQKSFMIVGFSDKVGLRSLEPHSVHTVSKGDLR